MMHNNQTLIYRYEVRFVLDQRAELDFYSASSLIQQSSGVDLGSNPDRIKPKTMKLIFVPSPVSMQH
jgi:hypothetical protein